MATTDTISCKQFSSFLVSQEPVFDKEILRDVRPSDGLIGYYLSSQFDAYSGVAHVFDRFNSVFPNLTNPWTAKPYSTCGVQNLPTGQTPCAGNPCDPLGNKIGWGYTRGVYFLEQQSWESDLLCFDEILPKTKAKEHFQQIIDEVLRPATNWIMTDYLLKRAADFAGRKWLVATGLPTFTFSWAAGGYVTMTSSAEPTGMLTPSILQSRVRHQYLQGAVMASKEGFDSLQLHTDMDTLHRLMQEDPTLKALWRFASFGPAAKEFYKYGLSAVVGDFMVKVLQFPIRFIKTATNTFQVVLPYRNEATTEGIRSVPNDDYDKAQYQWSYINNPRALRVLPFKAEAVNPQMPFVVRDYAGRWRFVNNDLGSCGGQAIDNSRGNKGKFIADFLLAVKPEHPEWLELIFHKVDKPCVTITDVCNPYPGYPAQSYSSANVPCPQVLVFTPLLKAGTYQIAANTITCNGNVLTHAAISTPTTLALLVTALTAAAGSLGTWAVVAGSSTQIQLTGATCSTVELPFLI